MNPNPILIFAVVVSFVLLPTGEPDLAADRAALLALRSSLKGRPLLWNTSEPTPCSWPGVECRSGGVTELHLPGMGLSGEVPPNTIGNLTKLQTLSLRFNALSGPLPSDIAAVSSLRNVYLQDNKFSGDIPEFVYALPGLLRLNLASNNFSGPILPSFNNLTRLKILFLENNHLSGSIPDLNLPGLVQFNVSNNQLTGPIPSKLAGQPASAFSGNSLCGGPLLACPGTTVKTRKKLPAGAIAGIIIGSVIGFFIIMLILFFLCRRRANKDDPKGARKTEAGNPGEKSAEYTDSSGNVYPAAASTMAKKGSGKFTASNRLVFFGKSDRAFDLEDLLRASAEVLGNGTFGAAYKAVMETGLVVAVKRLKNVAVPEKEFGEIITAIGERSHENLVSLRAYFYSRDEKLLVYDYLPMGSLSSLLHGNSRTPLNWETRSTIALGAARGIAYLHAQGPKVSHGNITSSNILLTKSYEACVSDFGLAQLVGPAPTPNRVAGYRAPEVTDPRKVSQKGDVYSFGVLLLELLTAKAPANPNLNEEGVDLPRWVQSVVREEWTSEVFDLELLRYQDVEEDMVQMLQLAVDCVAQYPDQRPSMKDVTSRIEDLCHLSSGLQPDDTVHDADAKSSD